MDKPKKLVCPFEWSRQESEHRSRCFCQRQNTIPAHTFFDNYCCGVHRHFFELFCPRPQFIIKFYVEIISQRLKPKNDRIRSLGILL